MKHLLTGIGIGALLGLGVYGVFTEESTPKSAPSSMYPRITYGDTSGIDRYMKAQEEKESRAKHDEEVIQEATRRARAEAAFVNSNEELVK